MTDKELEKLLGLSSPPIAIGLLDETPEGVGRWEGGAAPAGCSFWRLAMRGGTFYTVPADHWNCAVGTHTHGLGEGAPEGQLMDTVKLMVSNGYLRESEAPGIPALDRGPKYVAYAPLGQARFRADVVILAAKPAAAMLVYEAAVRSGLAKGPVEGLGRPACAVVPFALGRKQPALSFGCKGNRTFTGLPDEEMYLCVPGGDWVKLLSALGEIGEANRAMGEYYAQRRSLFPILN
jgi:uncharacterized protein (DUF169 family)